MGATVEQDTDLPIAAHPAYGLIESIDAADASTRRRTSSSGGAT